MNADIVIGIFVGGQSTRMAGRPKGLLPAPGSGEPLLGRALRLCAETLPAAPRFLVGDARAYGDFGCVALADDPVGIGPLGGLRALLLEASRLGKAHVIALSCDLPRFSAGLLARLAVEQPLAEALAPREGERWQPFFARYASPRAALAAAEALAAGDRSLQRVLARLATRELELCASERAELRDWDRPEDIGPAP